MGKFNAGDLDEAIHKKPRLTAKIMAEVTEIIKNRSGAFIFASSVKHCEECAEALPPEQTAVITGNTPDSVREHYITQARAGIIKYLVNVNVLCTGVDVPNFDTVVFVRPTESLVLYMQCLGRGLRLSEGKTDCLILDYAGNLDRHGDIDNPIINKALTQNSEGNPDYCIECFHCNSMNTVMARRCIGVKDEKRCDHWFEFKECPCCGTKNDIVSRQCRECHIELIDPNRNLKENASNKEKMIFDVRQTIYGMSIVNGAPRFEITYMINSRSNHTQYVKAHENFLLSTEKSIRFFYHAITKLHFIHPHQAYTRLQNPQYLKSVIENGELYAPRQIECIEQDGTRLKVVGKVFDHPIVDEIERQIDVIHTFYNWCNIRNTITFEYLVRENDEFILIKDNYKLKTPTSYKRFSKNYGTSVGKNIETITKNQQDLMLPTKIWVNEQNKMKRFVEDAKKVTHYDNRDNICRRTYLSRAYEKWIKIVRTETFGTHVATGRDGKKFKVYRVQMYGHFMCHRQYDDEYFDLLVEVSCKISAHDIALVMDKTYTHFKVVADGRHVGDVDVWQSVTGEEFKKQHCFNWDE